MTRKLLLAAALFAVLLCAAAGAAALERWTTYANPRFGTTITYPADLFAQHDAAPANGDGQAFRSRDGRARLAVWGSYNVSSDTPESYLESVVKPTGVTYRRVTATYFVVSGRRDGDIYYQRCNFAAKPDDVIHCFEATYPAADKAAMDAIVPRLSESLHGAATGFR
jgi:hypothetical protein